MVPLQIDNGASHVWCPGCESAVRDLSATPCPRCHRCAYCGRKLNSEDMLCTCSEKDNYESVESILRTYGISEAQVPRERKRAEIRLQMDVTKKLVGRIGAGALLWAIPIYNAMGGSRTLSSMIVLVTIGTIAMVAFFEINSRLFRSIEDYRLEREFRCE
jgi:hypothetical protein